MTLAEILQHEPLILTECAISERLRRRQDISLHPRLFNTPLIYDDNAAATMTEIYAQYREIAKKARVPQILCAPTWRVNRERMAEAGYPDSLLDDAVSYMKKLQRLWQDSASPLFIAGLLGPKNDCYSASEALDPASSWKFHLWQLNRLQAAGTDCVLAQTIPAVSEALGIAEAAAQIGTGIIISFVIDRNGRVLDGTPLSEAIQLVDNRISPQPLGYMVNCVYPTFLQAEKQPKQLFTRLLGIQANSSSKDHTELDGSDILHQDDLNHWGEAMITLNRVYGVKILGGCCGTDDRYLRYLADTITGC